MSIQNQNENLVMNLNENQDQDQDQDQNQDNKQQNLYDLKKLFLNQTTILNKLTMIKIF